MNAANENQHWISQHLLKRFKSVGSPLKCYQIETELWVDRSLRNACAYPGYNQLLLSGKPDNSVEAEFSKIESKLPAALRALESVAGESLIELPPEVYESLCSYCAFLKGIAPYSKPGAVVSFLYRLNRELENGNNSLLRELNLSDEAISELRRQVAAGRKVVVEPGSSLQLVHRIQFTTSYHPNLIQFLHTDWAVASSPIQFPMADVGLVPVCLKDYNADLYLLPIGPNLLLRGVFSHDLSKNTSNPIVRGLCLSRVEAMRCFDFICAAAIAELICAEELPGIAEARRRSRANGTQFCQIPDLESIKAAGLKDAGDGALRLRCVPVEDYVKVVHSYIRP